MIFRIAISLISLILAYFLPDFLHDCFMILPDFFLVISVGDVVPPPHPTPHTYIHTYTHNTLTHSLAPNVVMDCEIRVHQSNKHLSSKTEIASSQHKTESKPKAELIVMK